MKVGLFFGSFNPIHVGHLIIANLIKESDYVDQVWFIVSPQNPFKNRKTLLHEFDRIDMVRAAIEDEPSFQASDIEFKMPKPSYTIDTLVRLHEKYPTYEFKLIAGEDNLEHFHKWKNSEQLLNDYKIIIYPRPHTVDSELKSHASIELLDAPKIDISATFIRQQAGKGKSVRYMVNDKVQELISSRGYYQ